MSRDFLKGASRIVVKIGSAILTGPGGELEEGVFNSLASQIARLKASGRAFAIVSSGAVAAGVRRLGLKDRPRTISEKQAAAAVGQSYLMWRYERAFGRYGQRVAQLLLTHEDLKDRRRYLNSRRTLATLLALGVIPIVNENDTVVVEEIMLGDNDNLSAMVATLMDAHLLIMLSDIDGLYKGDPRLDPHAQLIPLVSEIDPSLEGMAGGAGSPTGVGGMRTKLQAARGATRAGIATVIANGRARDVVPRILSGEEIGTLFLPKGDPLSKRKHWIAFVLKPRGWVVVDEGAKEALVMKGKSLLPSGIVAISGKFDIGDPIEVRDNKGRPLARGLTNYASGEINKIKGVKSKDIEEVLGYKYEDEVIHRDDLVVI